MVHKVTSVNEFKSNGLHVNVYEFNLSLTVIVTVELLKLILDQIIALSSKT